jgi:hypothetical protein
MSATPMVVYDGMRALGTIEDHGKNDVRAWLGTGDESKPLGSFPTRRDAMRAVSEAVRRGR